MKKDNVTELLIQEIYFLKECRPIIFTSNSTGAFCSQILNVSINYQLEFHCDLQKATGEKISGQMAEISIHNRES